MTEDRAVELINEWLNLAKDVGDMNLNRMNMTKKDTTVQWIERMSFDKKSMIITNKCFQKQRT